MIRAFIRFDIGLAPEDTHQSQLEPIRYPTPNKGGSYPRALWICGGASEALHQALEERDAAMIRDKISQALKEAMKAKDEAKTSTLRMVNAGIKQKDIDVARPRGDEHIGDDEVLNLLQSLIKSRRESIELYKQGGRQDLVDKEGAEIAVIEQFLPKQMGVEETRAVIRELVAALGASSVKDMGKVMAALKSKYAGQLDMTKASAAVKEVLSSK